MGYKGGYDICFFNPPEKYMPAENIILINVIDIQYRNML